MNFTNISLGVMCIISLYLLVKYIILQSEIQRIDGVINTSYARIYNNFSAIDEKIYKQFSTKRQKETEDKMASLFDKHKEVEDRYESIVKIFLILEFKRLNKPKYTIGDKKALKGYIITDIVVVGDIMKRFRADISTSGIGVMCTDLSFREWINTLHYEYSATHLITGETTKFKE